MRTTSTRCGTDTGCPRSKALHGGKGRERSSLHAANMLPHASSAICSSE